MIFSNTPHVAGAPLPENEWGIDLLISRQKLPFISRDNPGFGIGEHLLNGARMGIVVPSQQTPIFPDEDEWRDRAVKMSRMAALPEQKILFIELGPEDDAPVRKIYTELANLWALLGGICLFCQNGELNNIVVWVESKLGYSESAVLKRWKRLEKEMNNET